MVTPHFAVNFARGLYYDDFMGALRSPYYDFFRRKEAISKKSPWSLLRRFPLFFLTGTVTRGLYYDDFRYFFNWHGDSPFCCKKPRGLYLDHFMGSLILRLFRRRGLTASDGPLLRPFSSHVRPFSSQVRIERSGFHVFTGLESI